MRTPEERLEQKHDVMYARFGCVNCLWYGVECNAQGRYIPKTTEDGQVTCLNYDYCG